MLQYIIWDLQAEIIPGFHVRWYGLLFAIGFYASYTILSKIFKKEGLTQKQADSFTFTTFILLIAGLRLGHCLFYEPTVYLQDPIRILFVWEGGLASHGGAVGLLVSFYLFTRKSGKSFMWIASRAAVVIPLTATCVRLGNLANSEIYGIATTLPWGFIFTKDALVSTTPDVLFETLAKAGIIAQNMQESFMGYFSVYANELRSGVALETLQKVLVQAKFVSSQNSSEVADALVQNKIITANHPTQLYEAIVYIGTFALLMYYYFTTKAKEKIVSNYLILGLIFVIIFGFRFVVEFIKNDQVDFENTMALNMGQILSIPFILFGAFCLYKHFTAAKEVV